MRTRIQHRSVYRYSQSVLLDPHILRFRPREDASHRLSAFTLDVEPAPVGQTDLFDLEGNAATSIWFQQPTDSLTITARMEVETLPTNPFSFIISDPGCLHVPATLPPCCAARLHPFVARDQPSDDVNHWTASIAAGANGGTLDFLVALSRQIQASCRMIVREHGAPLAPALTLAGREGSCRDLAALFIDAARAMNLPTRFESGYELGDDSRELQDLHAWAEVYLPGAGWRGFDPSQGLAVAEGHIPVAAGPSPLEATPVFGAFRGAATASMQVELLVTSL